MVNELKKPEAYIFFPFNIGISYTMISPSTLLYKGRMSSQTKLIDSHKSK